MVITVTYSDSTTKITKDYTYSPTTALTADDSIITISYTEMGVTVSTQQSITIITSVAVNTLPVGTILKIKENNVLTDYIIVNQGNPDNSLYDESCDGTWLLRQDIAENRVWDSGNSNVLESSDIQSYLNNTWINRYDTDIRNAIKQVKIPYRQNGGKGGTDRNGANGLSCKIFLLSGKEVGWDSSDNRYFPNDGAKLSYFLDGTSSSANQKRVATLNGSATGWWPRSPYANGTGSVWLVDSSGDYNRWGANGSYGVRPAFILNPNTQVNPDMTLVDDTGGQYEPPVLLSSKAVGDIVTIKENNTPVDYIVVQQGAPSGYDSSCDGAWLLRKDCIDNLYWSIENQQQIYEGCNIDTWMNNTFYNYFDNDFKQKIKSVSIPIIAAWHNSTTKNYQTKIFALSLNEMNWIHVSYPNGIPLEGGVSLSYFASAPDSNDNSEIRIAYKDGASTFYWLRSIDFASFAMYSAFEVTANGGFTSEQTIYTERPVRPCFVLPSDQIGVNNDGSLYVIS